MLGDGARVTGLVLTALLPFVLVFGGMGLAVWYAARRVRRAAAHGAAGRAGLSSAAGRPRRPGARSPAADGPRGAVRPPGYSPCRATDDDICQEAAR